MCATDKDRGGLSPPWLIVVGVFSHNLISIGEYQRQLWFVSTGIIKNIKCFLYSRIAHVETRAGDHASGSSGANSVFAAVRVMRDQFRSVEERTKTANTIGKIYTGRVCDGVTLTLSKTYGDLIRQCKRNHLRRKNCFGRDLSPQLTFMTRKSAAQY